MSNLNDHTRNQWKTATTRVLRLAPCASTEALMTLINQLANHVPQDSTNQTAQPEHIDRHAEHETKARTKHTRKP